MIDAFRILPSKPEVVTIRVLGLKSSASQAKLLDVSWRCSREILGQKLNTESVQTAKIVLRN